LEKISNFLQDVNILTEFKLLDNFSVF